MGSGACGGVVVHRTQQRQGDAEQDGNKWNTGDGTKEEERGRMTKRARSVRGGKAVGRLETPNALLIKAGLGEDAGVQ